MPNHCVNITTLYGTSYNINKVKRILEAAEVQKPGYNGETYTEEDFIEALYPVPPILEHVCTGSKTFEVDGEEVDLTTWYKDYSTGEERPYTIEELKELSSIEGDSRYDWAIRNWGTKWGSYDVRKEVVPLWESLPSYIVKPTRANSSITIRYATAWAPAIQALEHISTEYDVEAITVCIEIGASYVCIPCTKGRETTYILDSAVHGDDWYYDYDEEDFHKELPEDADEDRFMGVTEAAKDVYEVTNEFGG